MVEPVGMGSRSNTCQHPVCSSLSPQHLSLPQSPWRVHRNLVIQGLRELAHLVKLLLHDVSHNTATLSISAGSWLQGLALCSAQSSWVQRLGNAVFLSKPLLLQATGLSFRGGLPRMIPSPPHRVEAEPPLSPRGAMAVPPTDPGARVFSNRGCVFSLRTSLRTKAPSTVVISVQKKQ